MPAKPKAKAVPRSSAAVEDYLERILELINTKGYARVVDIAQSLKISQASVTNMIQRMDADGLLKYERYRGMALTASGEALANQAGSRPKARSRKTDGDGSTAINTPRGASASRNRDSSHRSGRQCRLSAARTRS